MQAMHTIIKECRTGRARYKYGLLTEKGSLVPLKDVSVEITISGFVANVVSSLQYENNEVDPVVATFTFPLDDGSAVYQFEAFIEGRHIIAECQEKEDARQTYNDAIEDGRTAMLLEENDTAGDIFRCLVGNLPPKTVSKLVIGYVIELPVELDGKLRFTLPVILNPRFSQDVQKDIPYAFKLSATVEGSKEVKAVTASQPHIEIDYSESRKNVKVLFNDDFTFDADVRLYVEYENPYEPECLVEKGDPEKSGFLAEDVLMVNLFTNIDTVGTTSKGEYIFVLDRSGSMGEDVDGTSSRMTRSKEALVLFLKSLPVGCYFNIVSFGSWHEFLFDSGSVEYTEENLNKALSKLTKMKANMGGTKILEPLNAIYKQTNLAGHPRQIFLLTDGETTNTNKVIQAVRKNCSTARLFSIGIGDGASTALVNGVARAGNGKAEFIKDSERIQPKVVSLLKFAMQPSITDVKIDWELPTGVSTMMIPEAPLFLFDGDRVILYSLLQGNTQSQISGKVFINGKTDKAPVNISANFFYDKSADVSSFAPLHRLAAKTQIKLLEDEDALRTEKKQQIIDLSVASNMVSKHTSFVAIDKERRVKVTGKRLIGNVPKRARYSRNCSANIPSCNYISNSQIESNAMKAPRRCSMAPDGISSAKKSRFILDIEERQKIVDDDEDDNAGHDDEADDAGHDDEADYDIYRAAPSPRQHADADRMAPPQRDVICIDDDEADDLGHVDDSESDIEFDHAGHDDKDDDVIFISEETADLPKSGDGGIDWQYNSSSDEDEEKKLGDPPVAKSGDGLMDMICMQAFRGNWTLSPDVCKALKVDIKVLKGLNLSKDDDVLATLAVLVWLEVNYKGQHAEWEMIETKALTWLKTAQMDDLTVKENMKSIQDAVASLMKV